MEPIRVAAPAKLNLFLHITGKRPDGYHLLDSFAVFTQLGDMLTITPADTLAFAMDGPFAPMLAQDETENLVMRAAKMLQPHARGTPGAHIHLTKNLPVGAGLGGGSSDAATAILVLRHIWELSIDDDALLDMALTLGSDLPVCLLRSAAWMRGIGEQVMPMHMHGGAWIVLVNPRKPLSTPDVYRRFAGPFLPEAQVPEAIHNFNTLVDVIADKQNVLQEAAQSLMPEIGDMLASLEQTSGCRIARMSGSGATCFGMYATQAQAVAAAEHIHQQRKDWWIAVTPLLEDHHHHG